MFIMVDYDTDYDTDKLFQGQSMLSYGLGDNKVLSAFF